jgi:peptidoglycan/LPS O-acetylase OafA/YrhL
MAALNPTDQTQAVRVESDRVPETRPRGERLAAVDGLRALAALWVVFFHIRAFSGATSWPIPGLDFFFRSGSIGVSLFLVISGFCLFVPFAGGRISRFNTRSFLLRRCRRLLPAFYASIVFALALETLGGSRLGFQPMSLGMAIWQVFAHATLIHTFFVSSFYALNGAYWSLGLEWQLYLALPLLVLGARRFGLTKTLAGAALVNVVYRLALAGVIAVGILPGDSLLATTVLPNLLPGRWAEFVLGMVAAELYASGRLGVWVGRLRYALVALVPAGVIAVGQPLSHLLFGAAFFVLLCMALVERSLVSRLLSWQPLVTIGLMSYSLYLVHQPLIQAMAYALRTYAHASPTETFIGLVLLLPVVFLATLGLFFGVERLTLGSRPVPISALVARLRGKEASTTIRQPRIAAPAAR